MGTNYYFGKKRELHIGKVSAEQVPTFSWAAHPIRLLFDRRNIYNEYGVKISLKKFTNIVKDCFNKYDLIGREFC